jgi:hypothetical protein
LSFDLPLLSDLSGLRNPEDPLSGNLDTLLSMRRTKMQRHS